MKKFLIALLLAGSAVSAVNAASLHLTADAPVARLDGTPLPASEIKHYKLYHWDPSGNLVETILTELDHTIDNVSSGVHRFGLSTVDTQDQEGPQTTLEVPVRALPASPVFTRVIVERCNSSTGDCSQIAIINSSPTN